MFFGTTEETATWILNRPANVAELATALKSDKLRANLREADIAEGPLRLTGTPDGRLLLLWNIDYLSGTGEERWGLIKLDRPFGLLEEPAVLRRVLQTFLEVTSLRLRNLLLDTKLIHRSHEDGTNTIRADRGDAGASLNLAYVEEAVSLAAAPRRFILFVGPAFNFMDLRSRALAEVAESKSLLEGAQRALNRKERRPLLDSVISADQPLPLASETPFDRVTIVTKDAPGSEERYSTAAWTFSEWMKTPEALSPQQRGILASNAPLTHPMRIIGPAGSGKTLTMQLLALKHLREAKQNDEPLTVLYIVHNAAMAESLRLRFQVLSGHDVLSEGAKQRLDIKTLSEYAQEQLQLEDTLIIDKDAYETKLFQLAQVSDAINAEVEARAEPRSEFGDAYIIGLLYEEPTLRSIFAQLITAEISTAIKGHGLTSDRQRYVFADRPLSRLHRVMNTFDRDFVFSVFQRYHREVFEINGYLDTDDIALTLFSNLNTPLWKLKRGHDGYDMVLVDETQLFNENERRIFHLLTKRQDAPQPIALALDEGQEFFGQTSAGLSALGIADIEEERLPANHRSTKEIVDLAFFVISKSTDLFGPGFPKYSVETVTISSDDKKARFPRLEVMGPESRGIGKFVAKRISELRSHNVSSICVICHADVYWEDVVREVKAKAGEVKDRFEMLTRRGQSIDDGGPFIAVSRPAYVGGQEFDAVIAVGLEYGLVPPHVPGNNALESALYQQAVREVYLSVSRARYQVIIVNSAGAAPNEIIREAVASGRILAG
jgi:superfamily I DNA/RNA helicase